MINLAFKIGLLFTAITALCLTFDKWDKGTAPTSGLALIAASIAFTGGLISNKK